MLHRPHARFATPAPAKGGAAALALSAGCECQSPGLRVSAREDWLASDLSRA